MKKLTDEVREHLWLCVKALPDLPERNPDGSIRLVKRIEFGSAVLANYSKLKNGGIQLPSYNTIKPTDKITITVPKLRDKFMYVKKAWEADNLQPALEAWEKDYRAYVAWLNDWAAKKANKEVSDKV
jgi:hypothetical protein